METLTGVLLDVSGSMRESAVGEIDEEGGEWARSIFEVIDNFVKYDVSLNNHIFAFGVGARYGNGVFDIIKTIEQFQNKNTQERLNSPPTYDDVLEEFFHLMEANGAYNIQKWATRNVIKDAIPFKMAVLLLSALKSSKDFLRNFVRECLPRQCRNLGGDFVGSTLVQLMQNGASSMVTNFKQAGKDDIEDVELKAKCLLLKNVGSAFSLKTASDILHGCIDADKLKNDRIKELMETVQPFIYGRTPLHLALHEATKIFSKKKYSKHDKILFILSDGMPTDYVLSSVFVELKRLGVTIVSCLITRSHNIDPKKLYSVENINWDEGGKFLFNLSSTISSQLLPRTIFTKRGWDIDITNNETKLFLQINHPDNIHDVCDLARSVVCCQDSLSDLLVNVSLDICINQSTSEFKAQEQKGGTCYANAAAAVLHLSMKRIIGRDGGYPDFDNLRKVMIARHGEEGAPMFPVLDEITRENRLHCKKVERKDAMSAIVAKRPVVATFFLNDEEWDHFSEFFRRTPSGILTKAELDIGKRGEKEKLSGHAVVLTSFNSKCLRFMNSWGDSWADKGFFRVENSEVLGLEFYDVYWTLDDLSKREIEYFEKNGAKVAENIIKQLKSIQKAEYNCPHCGKSSPVTTYSGSLNKAVCPKCNKSFPSNKAGNILALNMYLTSLAK